MYGGDEMHTKFCSEILKERDHSEYLGLQRKIILMALREIG
jgi:hypothetical protein